MPSLQIKHRIWMGFSFLLALLLINASISFTDLTNTQSTIDAVIEESQPLVLEAHKLNGYLAKSSSSLTNYLLTKNNLQKENYLDSMQQADESLKRISVMEKVALSEPLTIAVAKLSEQLSFFQGYKERMLLLATDNMKNEIALQFAAQTINPQSNQALGILSSMIAAEMEEDSDVDRIQWLSIMQDVRYSFQRTISDTNLSYSTRSIYPEKYAG